MSTAIQTPPAHISEWKVVRGGLVVGAGLLAGQALGFIRQATIAYLLGTGPYADAVAVAFAPVDLWWAVLSTTVIFGFGPMLAAREDTAAGASFRDLLRPVVRLALVSTVLFLVFAPQLVHILAPGLPPETAEVASRLLRITALALPAVAWSTLFTTLLYSERKFAFPAFHQGAVNFFTIITAVLITGRYGHHYSAVGFAAGYAGGAWLQLGAAYGISRRMLRPRPRVSEPVKLSKLLAGPAPVLCYSILMGLNPVVTRALASTFGPGATAAFDYCLKLLGVPLALLVIPLSSSLLTEIAPFRLRQDHRAALGAIARSAVLTALAATVIVLAVTALGPWIVALLFERGHFSAVSTSTVSSILPGFFPALVAWSVVDVISRSLFSLGRTRIPILAAGSALVVNLIVSLLAPLRSIHVIGLGAVVGFVAAAALMAAHLRALRLRSG